MRRAEAPYPQGFAQRCRRGLSLGAEAGFPNLDEGLPVHPVGGFECGEVAGAGIILLRGKIHEGKVQAAEQLGEEHANGAAIEITKRMDGEETALGKGQELQGEIHVVPTGRRPSGLKVEAAIPHQHGKGMRRGRRERADGDLHIPPFSGPVRCQVATEALVKLEDQILVQEMGLKSPRLNRLLKTHDTLTEQGG